MASFKWPPEGSSSAGTVTEVDTGTGLTGGPITSTGTISLVSPVTPAQGGSGTTTAFTAGSVVYAGASGVYNQDNANFFWDATNHRLGIGETAPVAPVDVKRDGNGYSYNCQINNNDYFMLINLGTGNQQGFTAVGGIRWDWLPGGASAFQMNDTGSNNSVQLLSRHSRDLQLLPDGTNNTANIKLGSSGSQTTPIVEAQTAATVTAFSVAQSGAVTLGASATTPTHVINGAHTTGAQAATITNSPTAGNPAGFLTVTINGTTSYIPYWQ